MRKIYIHLLLGLFFVLGTLNIHAQVSSYLFANSAPGYSAISGGTVLGTTASDEEVFNNNVAGASAPVSGTGFPIGFNFTYNGVTYDKFAVAYNGYIVLGTGTFSIDNGLGSALSTSTVSGFANAIAVFNTDLAGQTGSELSYQLSGVAGSQVLTVQWKGVKRFSNTSNVNFQIKLNEGTNTINFIYGGVTTSTTPASNPQVGLRGATNADEHPRTTTTNWAATTLGTNASTCTFSTTVSPASGIAYTFTPPAPCTTPSSLAASISLTPGVSTIQGSFTAAPPTVPSGYLVVRTTTNAQPVPVDGTTYVTGTNAIGYIEYVNAAAGSWTSTALAATTPYYYWVFSYNNTSCTGGPKYSASATPGTATTTACSLTGTYDVGPGAVSGYLTLKSAVDDVVLKGITGSVVLELNAAYTSSTDVVFPIVLGSVPCAASGTTITIRPAAGAGAKTITSANTTATIDINGGNYWIIDGQQGGASGTKDLTIANTSTSGTAVRFINEGSNNTIKFSVLQGVNSGATGAVITFSGTTGTNGNDNDIITNCDVRDGATTPTNGIYSLGQSAAISNDNITISNNNIFNYFQAGNVTAGINVNTNNNSWTVSGNSFYQTASRTTTSGNQHSGVFINNNGTGFVITGNYIGGGAASCGGTAWTIGGAFANRFVGISVVAATAATTSIQGNTVANFAITLSSGATTANGIYSGIWVSGGNALIGTVTANIIGNTTTGNITITNATTAGIANIISYSGAGTADIRNNTIGSINLIGSSTSIGVGINGILVSTGTPTIINNIIGSATTTNSINSSTVVAGTVAQSMIGIQVAVGVATAFTISGNTIANITQAGTTTAGILRGISYAGTGFATISSNTIFNLSGANGNTTVSGGATGTEGILYTGSSTLGASISQNTIYTLIATNTGAVSTVACGIGYSNPTTGSISRNKIYDIRNSSTGTTATAPPTAIGIFIRALATDVTLSNNMISLGNSQTTNTQFVGIMNSFSTVGTIKAYFNSVNIEGTASSGALPSFGFLRGDNSTTAVTTPIDAKNNILTNSRSGGTGKHYAIGNDYGATASATGWAGGAADYNVLNAAAATVGYWTVDKTFGTWKTASASDANSYSNIPVTFVDAPNGNLHLNMGISPTQIESGGVSGTGVTVDFDNQARPGPAGSVNGGASAVDIGADEFDGVPLDITPPTITYTALGFTCNGAANRTLTATITDASGVPQSGAGLPVLYWKINAGAYAAATGTWVSGNTYTFSFGAGATTADVVSYYIAAQDNVLTPNVGAFPLAGAAGFTANPPAAATPPTTPSSYTISPVLSGTYNVGSGQTYPTLTAAITAYNTSCLGGAIIFQLMDAAYAEAGAMTIASNPDASSTNTLTIKPAGGVTASVSATVASGPVLKILGKYVTIDGSNSGGTSRDLTITNLGATSPNVLLIGSTGTTAITNVAVKNSVLINGLNTSSAFVVSDGTTLGNPGYFNNILIQNNSVQKAYIGIYSTAVVAAGNGSGLNIDGNSLNTAGANALRLVGIYAQGVDGATIQNNTIGNFETASNENDMGIWLATSTVNTTVSANTISSLSYTGTSTTSFAPVGINITSGNTGANINVTGNTISNFSVVSSGGASGTIISGLTVSSTTSGVTVSDNTISGIASNCPTTVAGILLSATASGITVQRNKVFNIKNSSSGQWGCNGILLNSTSAAANTTLKNNFIWDVASYGYTGGAGAVDNGYGIFINAGAGYNIYHNTVNLNTDQTVAGLPAAINIGVGVTAAGAINLVDNIFANNQTTTSGTGTRYAIYSSAPNTVFASIDYNNYYSAGTNLGSIASTDRATLANIRTGFGSNINSVSVSPAFVSSADLHLTAANCGLDGRGVPVAGITTDIDGNTRDLGAPDMGADEFTATLSGSLAIPTGAGTTNVTYNVSPAGTTFSNANCETIASVLPSGGSAVSGLIKAGVTVDASVQTYGAEPYTQRHYDIEPATNAAAATATVTLYFTDADFTNYNAASIGYKNLPTAALGNADPNIANLRVNQYHGTGTLPGNYTGAQEVIDPADANIFWNSTNSRWEVTIPVTGFSGFYITTVLSAPLPITIGYFRGAKQGTANILDWKVNVVNSSTVTLSLERSADGRTFGSIYSTTATDIRTQQPFTYADVNPLAGVNYYRLKMTDINGKVAYSSIVTLLNATKGFELINIAPNPVVSGNFKLNITAAQQTKMTVIITDMAGRIISSKEVTLIAGFNGIDMNVTNLAAGTYQLYGNTADGRTKALGFVKQ